MGDNPTWPGSSSSSSPSAARPTRRRRVPEADPDADALLADLLGATLVDAQDELWAAWAPARSAAGHPERAATLDDAAARPGPPRRSSEILRARPGRWPLLETLAGEVAPDADVRAWLVRSWLAPAG